MSLENADTLSPVMVPLGAPSGMQSEDKKEALGELLRMAREETPELWEDNFNILLSLIMKNIEDDEVIGNACYIDRSQHTSVLQNLLVACSKKDIFLTTIAYFEYLLVDDSLCSPYLSV